ncbi:MAG: methionyl-tRNA formyltransferase [Proteobacteria bacterium]|nr:methionyl-tRNA formyltransferase [Pseudomonadota bacterium]
MGQKLRIVFMGTPGLAIPALESLLLKHEVVAVYTKAPKPAGRGQQETLSVVHQMALQHNVAVHTPRTLRLPEEQEVLKTLKPDVIVVVAYGLILPQEVLDIPQYGCINIHPSDLPRWRGAAPLHWTILEGDRETAVCIMQMDAGMDTGPVLLRQKVSLNDHITTKELHDHAAKLGAGLLIEVLRQLPRGKVQPVKQSEANVTMARKLVPADEILDFERDVRLVQAQVRAFSPKPGSYFMYNGEIVKVIAADYELNHGLDAPAGTVLDEHLSIACHNGVLKPTLLQRAGKKMIYTDAFLRGFTIPKGVKL